MELEFTVWGPFLGDCGLDPLSARKGLMATVSGSSGLHLRLETQAALQAGMWDLGGTEISAESAARPGWCGPPQGAVGRASADREGLRWAWASCPPSFSPGSWSSRAHRGRTWVRSHGLGAAALPHTRQRRHFASLHALNQHIREEHRVSF